MANEEKLTQESKDFIVGVIKEYKLLGSEYKINVRSGTTRYKSIDYENKIIYVTVLGEKEVSTLKELYEKVVEQEKDPSDDWRRVLEKHKREKKVEAAIEYFNSEKEKSQSDDKTREKKRKLKNKPSYIKVKVGIATLLAVLSMLAVKSCDLQKEDIGQNTSYSDTTRDQDEEDIIDTVEEVTEDFVKQYLEAYNEKYGTNYNQADFITTNLRGIPIYKLEDGRKITRGNLPSKTKDALSKIGAYESVELNSDVVQIVTLDKKILGTYIVSTGEFIYSGNQLGDLEEDFEEPILEEMGINPDKLQSAAEVELAKGVENKESIDKRIKDYNKEEFEI